jgi:hypothetical protein
MKPVAGLLVITAGRCSVPWWARQRVHMATRMRLWRHAERVTTPTLKRGSAVAASPTLWMVSARSATLPDSQTITPWMSAVAPKPTKDHLRAIAHVVS